AGFGFSVEEVVDYFPMVKLVDGAVKRNQSPGRDRSSRWCAIWEVGSQGRFLASATMIVFLNVMKTTLPFGELDRKSTRLNSSHVSISYAVFCLKEKKAN